MNMTEHILSSNYRQCRAFLTSAYLCVTGTKPDDERLRKAIELVLDAAARIESSEAPSNVVPFPKRSGQGVSPAPV